MSMVLDTSVKLYACPACGAEPEQSCRRSNSRSSWMHYARWASAYEAIHGTKPTPEA